MVPYKGHNLTRKQKNFNYRLSSARVKIENAFSFLKSRWANLQFINIYNVSKAVEISIVSCVLHNFCIINHDYWLPTSNCDNNDLQDHLDDLEDFIDNNDRDQYFMGVVKRNQIADSLFN